MAYVPQFIPTNTQVLQGTLNQYQQAYDTETARQNQVADVYSAIPTTREYDTTKKNEVMGQFAKVTQDLDKKYNYDRASSQYAQELAKEITKLRSNPLWAHVQQKDELDKLRTNLIAQRGADYYENFNPNDVTLDNAKKLQDWKAMDLKDVKQTAALSGKEMATSFRGTSITKPIPGVIQYTDKYGAQTTEDALTFMNTKEGQDRLIKSITSAGFDPNDPVVYKAAHDAMLSNLVGENKISRDIDQDYLLNERDRLKNAQSNDGTWKERTNIGITEPSPIDRFSKLEKVNEELQTLDKLPELTPEQQTQRDILQRQADYARNIYVDVANKPSGQKSYIKGQLIINENITNPLIDKQLLFEEFEKYFVQSTDVGRSETMGVVANAGNQVLDWVKEGASGVIPSLDKSTGKEAFKSKTLKETSRDITLKMFGKANIQPTSHQTKDVEKEIYSAIKEWRTFYKEPNIGYKANIETPINEKLKSGTERVGRVYDPPFDVKSAEYKQGVDALVRNVGINAFDISEEKKGRMVPVKPNDINGLYSKLVKGKSDITMHAVMERESEPRIILTQSDGSKIQLTMNIDKMTPATANELANITGLPQFKDGLYKDIKLEPSRTYTLDDNKDKTLINILQKRYGTLEPFQGLQITKYEDPYKREKYLVKSDRWTQEGFPEGLDLEAKSSMMDELDDLYIDYIKNKQSKK